MAIVTTSIESAPFAGTRTSIGDLLGSGIRHVIGKPLPSDLLNASSRSISFFGRDQELEELHQWWGNRAPMGVLLVTGPAGCGKTRLMIEWCKQLQDQGGLAGFLPPHMELEDIAPLVKSARPRVLIVDNAEIRADLVREIIGELERSVAWSTKIRLVLLARNRGDWWQRLVEDNFRIERMIADCGRTIKLTPLIGQMARRRDVFSMIRYQIGSALGLPIDHTPVPNLALNHFSHPLFHIMGAMANLNGKQISGRDNLIRETLMYERQHWDDRVDSREPYDPSQRVLKRALHRVIPILSLWGTAPDRFVLNALFERTSAFPAGQRELIPTAIDLLERICGSGSGSDASQRGFKPDLLAEQLIAEALSQDPWLLDAAFDNTTFKETHHGLTVLCRLALDAPAEQRWLDEAIERRLEATAPVAIQVAMEVGDPAATSLAKAVLKSTDFALVKKLLDACPRNAENLAPFLTTATARVLARRKRMWPNPTETQEIELARLTNDLGYYLTLVGHRNDAFDVSREAVEHYWNLAKSKPDNYQPDLARALTNLANRLKTMGRSEDALKASKAAVDFYRNLALPQSARVTRHLPKRTGKKKFNSTNRNYPSYPDYPETALASASATVEYYQKKSEDRPLAYRADLAAALANQGMVFSALEQHGPAFEATVTAVELYRLLVMSQSRTYLPNLAMALGSLGKCMSHLGRHRESREAAQDAVDLYRELSKTGSDRYLPNLAMALYNLSVVLTELQRHEEALDVGRGAVDLYRELAKSRSDIFLPRLANALGTLGDTLSRLGRHEVALETTRGAVDLNRELATSKSHGSMRDLAESLSSLGNRLSALGRHHEALHAIKGAIDIYKEMAAERAHAPIPK